MIRFESVDKSDGQVSELEKQQIQAGYLAIICMFQGLSDIACYNILLNTVGMHITSISGMNVFCERAKEVVLANMEKGVEH